MRNYFALSLLLLGTSGSVFGCRSGKSDSTDGGGGQGGQGGSPSVLDAKLTKQVAEGYANVVAATYRDSHKSALMLQASIESFLDDPTNATLEAAREQWRAAREPYLQSEAFRFYDGPIDNPEDGPEGRLNAWPLDEAYIDYVKDKPEVGIVNDPSQEINAEDLAALNEQGGEKNIATGYHAIEFLLWGQDSSDDGPGDRSFTDYTTADNANRRAEYLRVVTELLVSDLEFLVNAWAPGKNNYRKDFLAEKPSEQLRRMLTGLIVLSGFETGGERLQTAYDTRAQEDEHSCFSDNTHRDMVGDIIGIQNVYLGKYESEDEDVSGKSLHELVAEVDSELAEKLQSRIAQSLALALDLEPPFDQEIVTKEGRKRVLALIESLRIEQEPLFEEVFQMFDLDIPNPE